MPDDQISAASLAGLTILLAGGNQKHAEISDELRRLDARLITLPVIEEESHSAAFDEAIANLYGYDWIIFKSVPAAEHFLRRLGQLGHETSDLDALRVCALGKATLAELERACVHVDLCTDFASKEIIKAFEAYLGGRDFLRGLNFLVPKAMTAQDSFSAALADAGARVDPVAAYDGGNGRDELARLGALLAGGGIDALIFSDVREVHSFIDLYDAQDLPRLLAGTAVFCLGESVAAAAAESGLNVALIPSARPVSALLRALFSHSSG